VLEIPSENSNNYRPATAERQTNTLRQKVSALAKVMSGFGDRTSAISQVIELS